MFHWMPNGFSTRTSPSKFKSFTPVLILSAGMEIKLSNQIKFSILDHIDDIIHQGLCCIKIFNRLQQIIYIEIVLCHISCFFQPARHCRQMFFLRHNLHSWLKMLLQSIGYTLQSPLDLHLCCDHCIAKTLRRSTDVQKQSPDRTQLLCLS